MPGIRGFSKEKGGINRARVSASGRLPIMEYAHMAVHEDGFVTATEYVADLDIASPRVYHIKPLAGYELHSVFIIKSSAACRIQIYEGTEIDTDGDGTRLTHMRNNRKSAVADTARDTTYHTPTVTDNGDLILDTYTGGSAGGIFVAPVGGESRQGQEIVLDPDKDYLIIVTALADNTVMSFSNEYYEVET